MRRSPRPPAPGAPHHIHAADARAPDHPSGSTPRRAPTTIDDLIHRLNTSCDLGFRVRDATWSPSKRADSLDDKIQGLIKRLFFSRKPGEKIGLLRVLREFEGKAGALKVRQDRLDLLWLELKAAAAASPAAEIRGADVNATASRATAPHALKGDVFKSFGEQNAKRTPESPREFHLYRTDDPESLYTTAPESGSTTEDEGDCSFPPSPSASIRSVAGRVQSIPYIPPDSRGRKRPSQSSDENGASPKLTKTSKGKWPSDQLLPGLSANLQAEMKQPSPFKKPSLDMARSYKAPSANTSFNTSFNSNTVFSSQHTAETQQTAATSFNSDFGNFDRVSPKVTRSSPTTMGSLEDRDLLDGIRRFEEDTARQGGRLHRPSNATTRTSTTYGSIDEDVMMDLSSNYGDAQTYDPTPEILSTVTRRTGFARKREEQTYSPVLRNPSPLPWTADKPINLSEPRTPSPSKHRPVSRLTPSSKPLSPSKNHNSVTTAGPPEPMAEKYSPSGYPWRVRDIPSLNIFVDDIDDSLREYPYFILFICLRVAMEHNLSLVDLLKGLDPSVAEADYDSFWAHIEGRPGVTASVRESRSVWAAAKDDMNGYTFKGNVNFNPKLNPRNREPIFKLGLSPIQKDNSCRLQRNFGADRFMYLTFPSMQSKPTTPHGITNEDLHSIEKKWLEWFLMQHSFLGREWRAFHLEPVKKGNRSQGERTFGSRVVLFATEGHQITTLCSIGSMINWFFPFEYNQKQTICKAFARLDLALSRTVPTLVFKPSQVRYVPDIVANGLPEDAQFNDQTLQWDDIKGEPAVMNDGCSLISLGAAQEIWRLYKRKTGRNDRMPTAFQARIGGAKGLWVVTPEPPRLATEILPLWINISDSQRKFQPHSDDLADERFDPMRLTFEVNDYSRMPTPSELHISFIPILVDRGVPKSAIENVMIRHLDAERNELLEMLEDAQKIYSRVHRQSNTVQDLEALRWEVGLPGALRDKVKLLIEAGFDPRQEPYLGNVLSMLIKQEHLEEEQKLRIPLAKSTFMFGIADPLGVLAPGEVHVQFSSFFEVPETEETFLSLENMDVLVARQPACRRSDLQRARAVSHPKLSYLVDVIVFPSCGQYPLAGKLQGGDYDGDKFWVCWEEELVQPFKNAPAPTQSLDHTRYGIKQDTTTLNAIMTSNDGNSHRIGDDEFPWVNEFLRRASEFRIQPSLLGQVTNFLEMQAYMENRVYSDTLNALCDMHDLLVDAPKQGYIFSGKDFGEAKRRLKILRKPSMPKNPEYKRAMEVASGRDPEGKKGPMNKHNVIDYLYFLVVKKHHQETQVLVKKRLSKEIQDDEHVTFLYFREANRENTAVTVELDRLKAYFIEIHRKWAKSFQGKDSGLGTSKGKTTSERNKAAVRECYNEYQALKPEKDQLIEIQMWMEPYLSPNTALWPLLRASALYAAYPRKADFVYQMAGEDIARLKAYSLNTRGSRTITGPIYSILRPRLPPNPVQAGSGGSDEEEELDEEEEADDDDSFVTPMEGVN